MEQAYKSKLQSYALKQNLDLPVYATERQGPPHAPKFRTKVTFCDKTYQSPDFFPTLKSSEHAAAKLALASITPPPQQQKQQRQKSLEEASGGTAYKNLLQEIAQKRNSLLPVYSTVTTGPSHSPTFTSSVEFDGKVFNGEEAKTKKVAEMNAAKVAYMSIKYGNSNPNPNPNPNQTSSPAPSSSSLSEKLEEAASSYVKKLQEQSPKTVTPDVPSKWVEVYEEDDKEINNRESHVPENPTPVEKMNITVAASSASENHHHHLANNGNETLESSVEKGEEESERKKMKKLVIPEGSHVVVRPWKPEMVLPGDAEMLFNDDRFVAYRLVNP